MTVMITEVYDALRDAGADEAKARKAAEVLAGYENRFTKIDLDLAEIKGDQRVIKALLGILVALFAALVVKLMVG